MEIIITGVLILILLFSWVNSLKALKKRAERKPAAAAIGIKQEVGFTTPAITLAVKQDLPSGKDAGWGRDPFSGRVYTAAKEETQKELRLSGVIWDKERPVAIINNKVVEKGSMIGGNTVVAIKEDRVVLSDGMSTFELKIGQ